MEFSRSQDGVDHGNLLRCLMRSGKEVVFSSQGYRADAVFTEVVVDMESSIIDP